jgi:hypothetical protein
VLTELGRAQLEATLHEFQQKWPATQQRIQAQGWEDGIVTDLLLLNKKPSREGTHPHVLSVWFVYSRALRVD